jgi:choline dehydrogenase-like flavoprotein
MALVPVQRLAEVFETLAPMTRDDALRRARLAIETLDATTSRADRLQLGLALYALDIPLLRVFFGGGLATFRTGSPRERERILLAWATSPIPQQRTAFQAWKRLGLFLAFADPGPDSDRPANAAWPPIGYRPPAIPDAPPALRTEAVDREPGPTLRFEADVAIVGSGAGGGIVAARLARAGLRVLVLEEGPDRLGPRTPSLEGEAWRDLMLDRGTTGPRDQSITMLAGATVGGGTTINWTTAFAPPDALRAQWQDEFGWDGFAGPEADADLARLAAELDLQPPTVVPAKDRVILDGARALGWEAHVTRRNAGPCVDCGGCTFGCAAGTKRSGPVAHLASAARDGARVVAGARVTRLVERNGRAAGVVGRLQPTGRPFVVDASRVVVAAGGLRTPVILERSGIGHPERGRNLRLHPVVAVIGVMDEPVEMWLGPSQAASCTQYLAPGPASADGIGPAHGGFLVEAAPPHPGLAAAAVAWSGRDDAAELLGRMRHWAPLIAIMRDAGGGRVRAAPGGRARIDYRLTRDDARTARRALVEMARLAVAGGAAEVRSGAMPPVRWRRGEALEPFLRTLERTDTGPNRVSLFSAHQLGSVRSGADPRFCPTDPGGRARRDTSGSLLPGAYVADGSLLPTAPGVNPMLTIMAAAERVARAVLADGDAPATR